MNIGQQLQLLSTLCNKKDLCIAALAAFHKHPENVLKNTLNEKWKLKQLRLKSLVLEFFIKICFSYFGATCIETTLGPNGEYFYLWPVGTTWPFFGQINIFIGII